MPGLQVLLFSIFKHFSVWLPTEYIYFVLIYQFSNAELQAEGKYFDIGNMIVLFFLYIYADVMSSDLQQGTFSFCSFFLIFVKVLPPMSPYVLLEITNKVYLLRCRYLLLISQ